MWVWAFLLLGRAMAVVTCGGFVTASSGLDVGGAKLDYSAVKMHLFTQEGLLKYSTECAPNGYYFIPVYDKGSFYLQIEGADGWTFDPPTANFVVSDTETGCNEDINFKFTGFSLIGQVVSEQEGECSAPGGPAGVTVTLTKDKQVIAIAVSNAKGKFTFPNVFPSTYVVTASHPVWTLGVKQVSAEVTWGHSELKHPFTVVGYPVRGSITASGAPIGDVDVYLFAEKRIGSLRCENEIHNAPEFKGRALCSVSTDNTGAFAFPDVPCGQYTLVPSYKKGATSFDVSPKHLPITVGHSSVDLGEALQVLGFSVSGRVVTAHGAGVPNVRILLNGEEKAITDITGKYVLEQVKTGKHTVEAVKDHVAFEKLEGVLLSPSVPVPDMKVKTYAICGQVKSVPPAPHEVVIGSAKASTDENGRFCIQVPPGVHTVTPALTQYEMFKGVHLSPLSRSVTITDAPVLNADFVQARLTVSGTVKCVARCDEVTVSMQAVQRPEDSFSQELDKAGRFTFKDVYPGQYKLTVRRDLWCWDQPSQEITVELSDVDNIVFSQSGYVFQVESSHAVALKATLGTQYDKTLDVQPGTNRFCLPFAGVYRIQPISCFRFSKDVYSFDTSIPRFLELKATDLLLKGRIIVQQTPASQAENSLPVHVRTQTNNVYNDNVETLHAVYKSTELLSALVKQCLATTSSDTTEGDAATKCGLGTAEGVDPLMRVYEYSYWAAPGGRFEITPPTNQASSKQPNSLLYYPRSVEIVLTSPGCPPPVQPFLGKAGIYLKGRVTPSVSDAKIVVEAASSGSASLTVPIEADGSYSAGPLYDDEEYTISVWSEGYHFVEEAPGNFRALKLGQITVSITVNGAPLSGVLLSLSGTNYRNNNETGADGSFRFSGLFPGTYFVRPLLKEFNFSPNSKSIELQEAKDLHETFTATRIAYSVFGSVKSLAGEPEQGLVVEALQVLEEDDSGKKTYPRFEETVTDVTGAYRLRGLLPNSTYVVSVNSLNSAQAKVANAHIEKTAPGSKTVHMAKEDITGIDFTSFRKLTRFDLTGRVEADSAILDTLEAVLMKDGSVLKVAPISKSMTFFEFSSLPEGHYVVYVRSSLSPNTHAFEAPIQEIHLQEHKHVVATFRANARTMSQEPTQSSFVAALFVVIVALMAFKKEKSLEVAHWLKDKAFPAQTLESRQGQRAKTPRAGDLKTPRGELRTPRELKTPRGRRN